MTLERPVVAVAGASGFVGQAVGRALGDRLHLIALSRGARAGLPGYREARACDLFSLKDAEAALVGVDVAIYLVHSMLPSARLVQGRFQDLDLICADNFARAAERAGVKRIIYLGGILPSDTATLSAHLTSRLEVERVLGGRRPALTVLRAGLIIGAGGSSFEIVTRLVRRLPAMLAPRWTSTPTQPIALSDVVDLLGYCVATPATAGEIYDVAGPEVVSYRALMQRVSVILRRQRRIVPLPIITPRLSALWISLITGAPRRLIAPLIDSLRHQMIAGDRRLQAAAGIPGLSLDAAITAALASADAAPPTAYQAQRGRARGVRSVQRLPLPAGRDAAWVADEYVRWLPRGARPLLRVERGPGPIRFFLTGTREPLLELTAAPERSQPDRQLLYVTGGRLAARGGRGRLEFREGPGATVLAAIHDFEPRLPWWIYRATQALIHRLVMWRFGRHLARLAPAAPTAMARAGDHGRAARNAPTAP
ncbi:MAG: hypothetical protein JNK64_15780 [Myxococcales bacterium]|nr:hypothetical protein [Myxococcales bacterium]